MPTLNGRLKMMAESGKARQILINIRSSLWFVPTLIVLGCMLLALALLALDSTFGKMLQAKAPGLFKHEPDGARAMLSAIATSMATIAGVVFSIVIVALSLASSQYTSRVLRKFMRDRTTQTVLGVFLGVYAYGLIVLRTMGKDAMVPPLAVSAGILLAIAAIGFFILFIHHIAASIQVSEITDSIMRETLDAFDCMHPDSLQDKADSFLPAADGEDIALAGGRAWHPIMALATGYIQTVELGKLTCAAKERNTVLRMEYGIGEFVTQNRPIAFMILDGAPDDELRRQVNDAYSVDGYRTIEQDPAFGIRQLVDISMKALSPSLNDSTTAATCIDHLGAILTYCADRCLAVPQRCEANQLRVIVCGLQFDDLVGLAFNQIIENSKGNTEIMLRALIALEKVGQVTRDPGRREVLIQRVQEIAETAGSTLDTSFARERVQQQLTRTGLSLDRYGRFTLHPF